MRLVGHIKLSLVIKVILIGLNLILVPLTLRMIGQEDFGLWSAAFSISQLINVFDAGLGNGLRNFISKNIEIASKDIIGDGIRATYNLFSRIIAVVIVALFMFAVLFQWFYSPEKCIYFIVFIATSINLFLRLIIGVKQGMQYHSYPDLYQIGNQTFILTALLLAIRFSPSLLQFALIYSIAPIIFGAIINLYEFRKGSLSTYIKASKRSHISDAKRTILTDSFMLFATKAGALVMLSTDNFLIQYFYGGIESSWYSINQRYFNLVVLFFGTITAAYWSSISLKFSTGDYDWIRINIQNMLKIWIAIPVLLLALLIIREEVFRLWIGEFSEGSFAVPYLFSVFFSLYTFVGIFSSFVNGIGDFQLHARISLLIAVINVPLSLFLMQIFDIPGIMIGSIVALMLKLQLIQRYRSFIQSNDA